MTKSFLELATEAVTALVNRGQLRIPQDKNESWEKHNAKAVKTFGWAVLELYREIENVPKRAREPRKEKKSQLIVR